MRVYKFLDAKFAIKTLTERRVKISRIDELNDPFELLPFDTRDRQVRVVLKQTRATLAQHRGILCFSAGWHNPVLWAHYSDKHRGMCIGFDVADEFVKRVRYVSKRLPPPRPQTRSDIKIAEEMLFTKYEHWSYEEEIRIFAALDVEVNGIFYGDFDDLGRPFVVIAGARCEVPRSQVESALSDTMCKSLKFKKARAAFGSFEIVEDNRGWG